MKKLIVLLLTTAVFTGCINMKQDNTESISSRPPRGMRYEDIADYEEILILLDRLTGARKELIADIDSRSTLISLKERFEALSGDYNNLSKDFPDQDTVRSLHALKIELAEVLGASSDPIIYDYFSGNMEPSEIRPDRTDTACLFKTSNGGKAPFFGYRAYSPFQSAMQEMIPVPKDKMVWFMIEYSQLQTWENHIPVVLGYRDQVNSAGYLTITPARYGNLYLQINDEELGEDVPFLVRITDLETGRAVVPENALDIAAQMDPSAEQIYGFDYPYKANFPGESKARYWIVPGRIEQSLPTGIYEVAVRRGIEHEVYRKTFTIKPDSLIRETVELKRWTNMKKDGWYAGEGHMHARIMSGTDAENILNWAIAADVHLTNVLFMGNFTQTWFDQRGFGSDYRVSRGDYVIVPGQEDPRGWGGHVVGHNISELVRSEEEYLSYRNVYDGIHNQGGVVGGAHILSGETIQGDRLAYMDIPWSRLDYYEILQVGQMDTAFYYDVLDMGFPMAPGSGTDIPWHGSIGEGRMYVNLKDEPFTPDAWFKGLREGRVFVSNSAMLELNVGEKGPGETVLATNENELIEIQASAWTRGNGQFIDRLELIINSEVVASVLPDGSSTKEELTFNLPADKGFWAALRAYTTDGGMAHTAPVYIMREGYRFWNRKRLPNLVNKYTVELDKLAEDIKSYKTRYEAGQIPHMDTSSQMIGRKASEFLKEIEETKRAYEEMLIDYNEE
ncbi:MAG: CehA/McbA family metallohydrolase [Spirochaetales bacterium]|nr:CehA/McbA family metallohydrolase [Spirochaetales bacterium]